MGGDGAYTYGITGAGILRAREAMERSQYAGPAPVPFDVYNEAIRRQKSGRMTVTSRTMRQILSQMVISESIFQRLGPALNSGSSIFMYGPPGNGKTSIARAFGNLVLEPEHVHSLRLVSGWAGHQSLRRGQPLPCAGK